MRRSARIQTLLLAGAALVALGGTAILRAQDPEDGKRGVARVSLVNGEVSVRRGDSGDWVAAAVNAPLVTEDHVSTGATSRTEMQLDSSNFMRLGSNAEVILAELQFRRSVIQLAHGTATFRVLRDSDADIEVDTPNVSVRPKNRGVYRITVRDDGQSEITVRSGEVDVFTPRGSQQLRAGQTMVARGTASDPEFQVVAAMAYDDWDRWNENRDQALERTVAYRYVSRDIYGAEDLDPYGQWVNEPQYGYVWRPVVSADWAPYQSGRWVWVDWYGWTWVSYDPWGWAPYHYGRWFHAAGGWCWYPGGMGERQYWSPALVAFFGYGGLGVGGGWGHIGWVPLGPHERFDRWWGGGFYGGYRHARGGDRSINVVNNVNIYNSYRNARVRNGVTGMQAGDFSSGRFHNQAAVRTADLQRASLVRGQLPAAPGDAHLRFSDRQTATVGRTAGNTRFYSTRQTDQVQRVPFAQQRQSLSQGSRLPASQHTAAVSGRSNSTAVRSESVRSSQGGQSGQAAQNSGWRRFGEPSGGSTGTNSGTVRSNATQPASSANRQNSSSGSSSGWRRFGEPSGSSAQSANRDSGSNRQGTVNRSGSASPQSSGTGNRESGGGWQRFGTPSGSGGQSSGSVNNGSSRQQFSGPSRTMGTSSQGSSGWNRQVQSSSGGSQQRYSSSPRQETVRVAPPVVRERSSGGGGGSAPSRNSAPSRSEGGRGGGGGRSH
jgi:hypothetical protein